MSLFFKCNKKEVYLKEGESFYLKANNVYRDAPADFINTLVDDVKKGIPWKNVIEKKVKQRDSWLAKIILDNNRNKFLDLIPESQNNYLALDVGAGLGQHTIDIAKKCKVCCIEPSPERFEFIKQITEQENCSRNCYFINTQLENLNIEEVFDYAVCIGVLEWVGKYKSGEKPIDTQLSFLKKIKYSLKSNKPLIVGIENRIGLKYLLGSKDDHIGIPYTTCCEYDDANEIWESRGEETLKVATHDFEQYMVLFNEAGFNDITFYAAFPDYKIPRNIVQCYPKDEMTEYFETNEFIEEHEGNDGSIFTRNKVLESLYNTLARLKIAKYFVPSYFIIAR